MKIRTFFVLSSLAVLGLISCQNNSSNPKVNLRFGNLVGMASNDAIKGESQLERIDYSVFARLIADEENFILIVRGSSEGCTCFQEWHDNVLAPYIRKNRLLVRIISL